MFVRSQMVEMFTFSRPTSQTTILPWHIQYIYIYAGVDIGDLFVSPNEPSSLSLMLSQFALYIARKLHFENGLIAIWIHFYANLHKIQRCNDAITLSHSRTEMLFHVRSPSGIWNCINVDAHYADISSLLFPRPSSLMRILWTVQHQEE